MGTSRRMSFGSKLKVYQSAAFKVKDPSAKQQKGQASDRPPVAIRLQINDIGQNESLLSPKGPQSIKNLKASTPFENEGRNAIGAIELVQSFHK